MQEKIHKKIFNLILDSGQQSLMADLGKKIGSLGLPNKDIEKIFKEQCKAAGVVGKVHIRLEVLPNKVFNLSIHKQPGASTLILQELNLKSGSAKVGHNQPIATITDQQLTNIALKKMSDMGISDDKSSSAYEKNLLAAKKMIAGTAKSMGIKIDFNVTLNKGDE